MRHHHTEGGGGRVWVIDPRDGSYSQYGKYTQAARIMDYIMYPVAIVVLGGVIPLLAKQNIQSIYAFLLS